MNRVPPHLTEFTSFLATLNRESDRGSVLITTAVLDDLLKRIIASFLVEHGDTQKLIDGFNAHWEHFLLAPLRRMRWH